jgi:hypothetical protein
MLRAAIAAIFALGLAVPLAAHDVTLPAEERIKPYTGELPPCENGNVIATIRERFIQRERGYWESTLAIDAVEHVHETAFRPWGAEFIPRRFCHARAHLNNGKVHRLDYSIIEGGNTLGYSWGVQWCVVGLDRNFHFAPQCRAARP